MNRHSVRVKDRAANDSNTNPVPVVRGLPGIGVALQLRRNALRFFADAVKRYGDRVELRVLGRRVLLLSNPFDVNNVLNVKTADFGRSTEVRSLRLVFGNGIYSSEGERWRNQRRTMEPKFHRPQLASYGSITIERMANRVVNWHSGETFDMFQEMTAFSTDLICGVIFGNEHQPHARNVANSISAIFKTLRSEILYLSLWRRFPFSRSRQWNRALMTLNSAINHMIGERRSRGPKISDTPDLLGALLGAENENGEKLSDEYIHDEIVTMFMAGQEALAVALSWAIVLLAQHPEIQEEAAAEIRNVTNGREVAPDDHPRLTFLQAVVQESLRLYPPLWAIGRSAIRDTMVRDLPVNTGTEVWIPILQIHLDDRWFAEPDRFNPYLWSDNARRPKFAHFPFGGGPRNCIAQHFAASQLVLGLAVILPRFRLNLKREPSIDMDAWLTLRPKNGVPVIVTAR